MNVQWAYVVVAIGLAGCGGVTAPRISDDAPTRSPPAVTAPLNEAQIRIADDGRCYARDHARDFVDRRGIVRSGNVIEFETLCPPFFTSEFVETLQRALAARGAYSGVITGILDDPTRAALREFQRQDGPDSELLWIGTARRLGLVRLSEAQIASLSE